MCGAGSRKEAGLKDAGVSSLRDTAVQTGNSAAEEEQNLEEELPPSPEGSTQFPLCVQTVQMACRLWMRLCSTTHLSPAPQRLLTAGGREQARRTSGSQQEEISMSRLPGPKGAEGARGGLNGTHRGRWGAGGRGSSGSKSSDCRVSISSANSSPLLTPIPPRPRPSRRFVPASERYPPDLQRDRQKNRLKRQAELLALQERARPLKPDRPPPHSQDSHLCSTSQLSGTSAPPCRKVGVSECCTFAFCSFRETLWILDVSGGNGVQRRRRLGGPVPQVTLPPPPPTSEPGFSSEITSSFFF